jgi:hypothetical protein
MPDPMSLLVATRTTAGLALDTMLSNDGIGFWVEVTTGAGSDTIVGAFTAGGAGLSMSGLEQPAVKVIRLTAEIITIRAFILTLDRLTVASIPAALCNFS